MVSYIESAAGVAAGGRTGVTAIVTGLLFVLALFVAPVVGAIPAAATAPALIIVGSLMMSVVSEIEWHDPEIAIPAFLTMMTIPLTFSIANGLAFGFTAYTLLKIAARQVPRGELVRVSADGAVYSALRVGGAGVGQASATGSSAAASRMRRASSAWASGHSHFDAAQHVGPEPVSGDQVAVFHHRLDAEGFQLAFHHVGLEDGAVGADRYQAIGHNGLHPKSTPSKKDILRFFNETCKLVLILQTFR